MRLKDDKSFPLRRLDTRTDFAAPVHHARQAREGRCATSTVRSDVRALANDDGRVDPGLPASFVHEAQVQLHQRHRAPLPALRHRQVLGPCVGAIDPTATSSSSRRGRGSSTATCANCAACCSARCTRPRNRSTSEAARRPATASTPLERAASVQNVVLDDHSNLDVLTVASDGGRAAVVRFRVRFGRVNRSQRALDRRSMDESDAEILESVLTDMYLDAASVPRRARADGRVRDAVDARVPVELRGRPARSPRLSAANGVARSSSRALTRSA